MTVIAYKSDEAEEPLSSTSWAKVAEVVIDVEGAGEHIFWASCEYAGQNVNEIVGIRVLLDGNEVNIDHFLPCLSNQFRTFSGMGLKNLPSGFYHLTLEARCLDATQTVKVRRKRLLCMKH